MIALLPTQRLALCLVTIATMAALIAVSHIFLIVTLLASALLVASLIADLALGPISVPIEIGRRHPVKLEQMTPSAVPYTISSKSAAWLDLDLVDNHDTCLTMNPDPIHARLQPLVETTVPVVWTGTVRGDVHLGRLDAAVRNMLGLLERRYRFELPAVISIVPRRAVLQAGSLTTRNRSLNAGLRSLRRPGVGSEFEGLRSYVPGDPFRMIHWKTTARRGSLTVIERQVERAQHVILAFDCGRLMSGRIDQRSKLDYTLEAGLALSRVGLVADDRVGAYAFADTERAWVAPRSGRTHHRRIVDACYDLQPVPRESDYERAAATLQRRLSKRSLVVLFSDIFDPDTTLETLGAFRTLTASNLVLVVLMNDSALEAAVATAPRDRRSALRTGVALALLDERRRALARLRAEIDVLDVAPTELAARTIDKYLAIKATGRL